MERKLNSNNRNLFYEIEEKLLFDEEIVFDEDKIKNYLLEKLSKKLSDQPLGKRGFYFEKIIYDFLKYMNLNLTETPATKDFGIDGIVKLGLSIFGDVDLGLQIKYKLIDSNDVDLFLTALKNSELQLGMLICKDSRRLEKYELNSKLKAILLSKGINVKEKLINDDVDINPVLVLKFEEVIQIVVSQIRAIARGIYKK